MKVNLGTLRASSPAFEHGGRIPDRYTAAGEGVSPPLSWNDAPEGTASFALWVHDPDAPLIGGFTHWTLWDIPADETSLNEDPAGYTTGSNGMGAPGWVPPSPPPGHGNHFYYFHVYALDAPLGLEPGADLDAFHAAVEDHVIAQARVVGTCGSD